MNLRNELKSSLLLSEIIEKSKITQLISHKYLSTILKSEFNIEIDKK